MEEQNNETINTLKNNSITNFLNDVFNSALNDVAHKKDNININNEIKKQEIKSNIQLKENKEKNINKNNEIIDSSNSIDNFNKALLIQPTINFTIKENYLNNEEQDCLKKLDISKIITLIKNKNKFLQIKKVNRIINDEEVYNKELKPDFKSMMKSFKENEEEIEKEYLEKEQLNPIISPVEILNNQNNSINEEEENEKLILKEKPATEIENQIQEDNNSISNNNLQLNSHITNFNDENLNQKNENEIKVERNLIDDEVYNKEIIPVIKGCCKEYKKEEEEIKESENKLNEVNPIICPVNILDSQNSLGNNLEPKSKNIFSNNEETKEEYIKNLNDINFNSTASFNKSTLYTTKNIKEQTSNKIPDKKNNEKNIFNKPINDKNFKRIKLNYNFPYNKIYNMFKDQSYKLPVKNYEVKQKTKEEKNKSIENISFRNSLHSYNNDSKSSFYNTKMKESNLNKSMQRNNSMRTFKKFPYNEEIENKKLLLNQNIMHRNYSSHNYFNNKKGSFCKNDCCQFLNKYPWTCPQCNKEHKCLHYKCQNCRKSLCFCKKK